MWKAETWIMILVACLIEKFKKMFSGGEIVEAML
jgi:hypothetical protein